MKKYSILLALVLLFGACEKRVDNLEKQDNNEMSFNITHPNKTTRVTATGFEQDDNIGIFCVEYLNGQSQQLQLGSNFLNNEKLTYDGVNWSGKRTLYWSDLAADFYAYYPYANIESVNAHIFDIAIDQQDEIAGGYEASDFIYAKSENVTRGVDGNISLQFRHILTKLNVKIVKGDTFEGELPNDIAVNIYNTVTTAKIDLTKGSATKYAYGKQNIIKTKRIDTNNFTAIVVPQFINQLTPLIEINMGGISYLLSYSISLRPRCEHTISVIINTSPDQEKIEISIDGTINDWV